MKRYQEGGEAEGLSGTAGKEGVNKKPRSPDDMSFSQAFRAARKGGKSAFMWRGKEYTTETKEEKEAAKKQKEDQQKKLKEDSEAASRQSTRNDAAMMLGKVRREAERSDKKDRPATGRSVAFEGGTNLRDRKGEFDLPENLRRGTFDNIRKSLGFNKGGKIDGCAKRGKTRGKII